MDSAWSIPVLVLAVALTVFAVANLRWMLYAWSSPEAYESVGFSRNRPATPLSFSIILPCRDEPEHVMTATVERILAQREADLELIISVGHDDLPTVAVAERIAAADPRISVSINHDEQKNKPKQLNTALQQCTKDVVGVIDAETLTHPDLLHRVEATFHDSGADVVQGAVQLVNLRDRWFTVRNCLEYRTWFRSRLHSYARQGFVPLGGNTVFVRRELLHSVAGWDDRCLAEDCDLGVRLSVERKRIVCAYDRELTTREEAPTTMQAFVKQRTRWVLGFLQVLAKGDWRRLPTRSERLGAWWVLVQQFTLIATGLAIPVAIVTTLLVDLPVLLVLLAYLPALVVVLTLAFEALILHELASDLALRVRLREYLLLVVTLPLYQVMLAVAALRATWKFLARDYAWEKTAHSGAHLAVETRAPEPVGAA